MEGLSEVAPTGLQMSPEVSWLAWDGEEEVSLRTHEEMGVGQNRQLPSRKEAEGEAAEKREEMLDTKEELGNAETEEESLAIQRWRKGGLGVETWSN